MELVRAMKRAGWREHHQTGSHLFLWHPEQRRTAIIPVHAGKTIRLGTLKSILDNANLDVDELIHLL